MTVGEKDLSKQYLESFGLPDDPRELLTPEEHDALNQHLANLGWQRQRIEAESRGLVLP